MQRILNYSLRVVKIGNFAAKSKVYCDRTNQNPNYYRKIFYLFGIIAIHLLVAQWIEHPPSKRRVFGSSPTREA